MFAVKGNQKAGPLVTKVVQGTRSVLVDVPSAWPGRAVAEEVKTRTGPKPISLIGSTGSIGTQVRYLHKQMTSFKFCTFIVLFFCNDIVECPTLCHCKLPDPWRT